MLETDVDRLESIKALGGQLVSTELGNLWALFDESGVSIQFDDTEFNSVKPTLTAVASDAKKFGLTSSGSSVSVGNKNFTVRTHQPDGAGFEIIFLDAD